MIKPSDRSKPNGDANEILLFCDAISNLGLAELPLKIHLEQHASISFFGETVLVLYVPFMDSLLSINLRVSLVNSTSYHFACVIYTGTNIPRAKISRLKITSFNIVISNKLLRFLGIFLWDILTVSKDNYRIQNIIRSIKLWGQKLPCLNNFIFQVNTINRFAE
jgi:hypothetical protein